MNLEIAKAKYAAYQVADIEHLFRGAPAPVKSDYGYQHGWIIVDGVSYSPEQLTGQPYDYTQGGWSHL